MNPIENDEGNVLGFLPFGGGNRSCIGSDFAIILCLLFLSSILREFNLESVQGFTPSPKYSVTIHSSNGIKVRLVKRS